MESSQVRAILFKNEHYPKDARRVLINPNITIEELMNLASEQLGIPASKIFSETGLLLSSLNSVSNGTIFYISQGEDFQVKPQSNLQKTQEKYSICILGAAAVGKTAITRRYVLNRFIINYDPIIEDYYTKNVVIDNEPALLTILDTAGMEDYMPEIDNWIDNKEGFILVYSIDLPDSLQRLRYFRDKILRSYQPQSNKESVMVIAANKIDLTDGYYLCEEGRKVAKEFGIKYIEVSAKTGQGIDELFAYIITTLRSRKIASRDPIEGPRLKKSCSLF